MEKENSHRFYWISKRIIDVIISSLAIIVSSPLMLVIAILIKLESEGPVFAPMPKRVGLNGKLFKMYKFRSMVKNGHELLTSDPKYKELHEKYKKNGYKLSVEEDPRITKLGKILRKTSLDEFPQFFNVLRGEMSFVGPRAYFPHELREQAEKFPKSKKSIRTTLSVKPGITGPWQVGGRSNIEFAKRILMDEEYAKSKSLIYDIKIMLRTPVAIIFRKGAI